MSEVVATIHADDKIIVQFIETQNTYPLNRYPRYAQLISDFPIESIGFTDLYNGEAEFELRTEATGQTIICIRYGTGRELEIPVSLVLAGLLYTIRTGIFGKQIKVFHLPFLDLNLGVGGKAEVQGVRTYLRLTTGQLRLLTFIAFPKMRELISQGTPLSRWITKFLERRDPS